MFIVDVNQISQLSFFQPGDNDVNDLCTISGIAAFSAQICHGFSKFSNDGSPHLVHVIRIRDNVEHTVKMWNAVSSLNPLTTVSISFAAII